MPTSTRRTRRPRSRRNKRHRKGLSHVQKMQVQRLIRGTEEVKTFTYTASTYLYSYANASSTSYAVGTNLIPVSPFNSIVQINQGTGDSNRIGNQIRTRSVKLKLNIAAASYDGVNNPTPTPFFVKIWVFKNKLSSQASDVQSSIQNTFMDNNTSAVGIQGNLLDMTRRVNKDVITLHKVYVRKVGVSESFPSGGGGQVATNYNANNDYKLNQFMVLDLTRYVYKDVLYNDNAGGPQTPATWVFLEAIPYNNDTIAIGIRPGILNYGIEYNYTDA